MGTGPRGAAALLALLASALSAADGLAPGSDAAGTYRLAGKAVVAAPPALDRTVEVHADALLRPGGEAGEILMTVAAQGASCELRARLDATGDLQLAPGQRCAVDLDAPDARGHLDGVLRSGRGHLAGEALALELSLDVDGSISVRTGGRVEVLGRGVDVPAAWMPAAPVHGRARAVAQGTRDRSRAAAAP